ncbi:UNVERIFIED_CONTAM: hypothetical protein Slati_2196500 [Sesamum latifolium]|uniref:Retrotransposon gag domain-containing protein n=1 Tax=Sesamum latifolium TaxID=2727402 RepID=A0AAW2WTK2_9LAMI
MQTRSRARDVPKGDTAPEAQLNGGQDPPRKQSPPCAPPPMSKLLSTERSPHLVSSLPPPPAGEHLPPPSKSTCEPPPPSPCRSVELSAAPKEEEQRHEEVNSRVSRPETAQEQTPPPKSRQPSAPPPFGGGGRGSLSATAVAPPRCSPFAPAILVEALPAGVKVSNLSEYNGTGNPQEHLDKFYAKADQYDLSHAAYCMVFCTMLSKRALAWFNQLPAGTISNLEQLTQCFLHHFSMNKRIPKMASFLFTISQKENLEGLCAKIQRIHSWKTMSC